MYYHLKEISIYYLWPNEIDVYHKKYSNTPCSYIKKWPFQNFLNAWYVVLKKQGYQNPHIHPGGWLSGVIYLKVVPSLDKNEGAIEFKALSFIWLHVLISVSRSLLISFLVLLLPAVQLDVLIFHAPCVDKNGNIQIGRRRELATLTHASKKVFVTTEQILDIDFFDNELSAATCLPALYVDGISVVENGAWPCALPGVYGQDNDEIKKYSIAAKTQKGFEQYMQNYLFN